MDFMMTYGWALLIILVALGTISFYFLRGSSFAPDVCVLIPGLGCSNAVAYQDSLRFTVTNGMGQDLTQFQVSAEGCGVASASSSLSNGEQKVFTLGGCSHSPQDVARHRLLVDYTPKGSTLSHSRDGDFQGVAEGGCLQTYCTSGGGPGSGGSFVPDGATTMLFHFDEGSPATQVVDSIKGAIGNIISALWIVRGSSPALQFDGSTSYVMANPLSLDELEEMTIEAFVRSDGAAGNDMIVNSGSAFRLWIAATSGNLNFAVYRSSYDAVSWPYPTDGQWHHVAGTYDGEFGTMALFIDGLFVASKQHSDGPGPIPANSPQKVSFGVALSGTDPFKGGIDEVRLSNAVRY